MDEPRSELKITADESDESPDFDALTPPTDLIRGDRTRDDFFDAVLGLDSPATASDVADLAGHGVDAAREYLEWFERMGIVTQLTDSPATYERNQEYLNWRRVQTLRRQYTSETLLEYLKTESERMKDFETEFNTTSPEAVSITQYAEDTNQPLEDVWEQLSAWKTARRHVMLLERALRSESGDAADRQAAV